MKNKEAVKTAQLEENKVFTDYNIMGKNNYINICIYNFIAENAPDAQLEEQLSNKSCFHGHPSSILGWGAPSALSFTYKQLLRGKK